MTVKKPQGSLSIKSLHTLEVGVHGCTWRCVLSLSYLDASVINYVACSGRIKTKIIKKNSCYWYKPKDTILKRTNRSINLS